MPRRLALAASTVVLSSSVWLACSSDDAASSSSSGGVPDGGASSSSSGSGSSSSGGSSSGDAGRPTCHTTPIADDAPRTIVISHPFDAKGSKDVRYERLVLAPSGAVERPNVVFSMGRNFDRDIVFTPDGVIGLSAQDDGTVGVFRVEADGKVTVVDAAWKGKGYVERVVMGKDGARAFLLDMNTKGNGGGVYEVAIGCDGKLEDRGQVLAGDNPAALAWLPNEVALVAGKTLGASAPADDLHLLDLAPSPGKRIGGGAAFADKDAIASSVAVSRDGKLAVVADNGIVVGSRLGVATLSGTTATRLATIAVKNPVSVAFSPFGNAAMVVGSDGEDAFYRAKVDTANATTPFLVDSAPIPYKFKKPQLPGEAHVLDRGPLKGRVVVAEVSGVRQVTFTAAGAIEDALYTELSTGDDLAGSVGALGLVH